MKTYTIQQFRERFSDDNACLDFLFELHYGKLTGCPNCSVESQFKRVKNRPCYQCDTCSHQIYPTVGTIFEKSKVSLSSWFLAIYLHSSTRNGIAAKELERTFGISYPAALRMAHKIKSTFIDNSPAMLTGEVTIDEVYVGMLSKNMHYDVRLAHKKDDKGRVVNKTGVMTFIENETGRVLTKVLGIETDPEKTFKEIVEDYVDPSATIVTDAYPAYKSLKKSFNKHVRVNHQRNEYVKDGYTTNRNENWNSNLKRMIKGSHIHVSPKHLPKYVAETNFRYMNRAEPENMFNKMLDVATRKVA